MMKWRGSGVFETASIMEFPFQSVYMVFFYKESVNKGNIYDGPFHTALFNIPSISIIAFRAGYYYHTCMSHGTYGNNNNTGIQQNES